MALLVKKSKAYCSDCGRPIQTLEEGVSSGKNIICRNCWGLEKYNQPSQSHPQDGQPAFSIEDGRYGRG